MMAINGEKSRNYIINQLLTQKIKDIEKKHGEIKIKQTALEKFRKKRFRKRAASSRKSETDRGL